MKCKEGERSSPEWDKGVETGKEKRDRVETEGR